MSDCLIGGYDPESVRRFMLDMVWGASRLIRLERYSHTAEIKLSDAGRDYVTTADRVAQQFYINHLTCQFPGVGILAEEDNAWTPCTIARRDIRWTIDPLDGTKAFVRKQSFGIATQLALVDFDDDNVIATYVGDVNSGEIYGFGPGGEVETRQVGEWRNRRLLDLENSPSLNDQYVQLRVLPEEHHSLIDALAHRVSSGGVFKGVEVHSGSIGLTFARLWKGEVGAVILPPNKETPWDSAPVYGINRRLNIVALHVSDDGRGFVEYAPRIQTETYRRDFDVVFVHQDRVSEIKAWAAARRA